MSRQLDPEAKRNVRDALERIGEWGLTREARKIDGVSGVTDAAEAERIAAGRRIAAWHKASARVVVESWGDVSPPAHPERGDQWLHHDPETPREWDGAQWFEIPKERWRGPTAALRNPVDVAEELVRSAGLPLSAEAVENVRRYAGAPVVAMGPVREVRDIRVNGESYGEKIERMAREQGRVMLDVRFPEPSPRPWSRVPVKRGVLVYFTHEHRVTTPDAAVRAVEKMGLPGIHDIRADAREDFERNAIVLKLSTLDPKCEWLPIVPEATEYPRWTPEELAEKLASVYPVRARRR